jgi:hypothetical protein
MKGRLSKEESALLRTVLTQEEEGALVEYLVKTAPHGFPDTHAHAKWHATPILQSCTGYSNATLGKCWLDHFLDCHSNQLHHYWSTPLTMVCGGAVNEGIIDH